MSRPVAQAPSTQPSRPLKRPSSLPPSSLFASAPGGPSTSIPPPGEVSATFQDLHPQRVPMQDQSSSKRYSKLLLQPATRTSVVTTTTTTTVQFAPILIPRSRGIISSRSSFSQPVPPSRAQPHQQPPLTPKSSFADFFERQEEQSRSDALHLDPKVYPLSQSSWPGGLKKFKLALGELEGTFYEDGQERYEGGKGHRRDDPFGSVSGTGSNAGGTDSWKGKGKERARSFSGANPLNFASVGTASTPLPSTSNTTTTTSTSISSHALQQRTPRSSNTNQRRRPSRRSRASVSTAFSGDANDDEDEEEHDLLRRPGRMSLDLDSDTVLGEARLPSPGPPPRKRPRASSHGSVNGDRPAPIQLREQSLFAAATIGATLPSPNQSPPSPVPTFVGGEDKDDADLEEEGDRDMMDDRDPDQQGLEDDEDSDQDPLSSLDLGSGTAISGLLSLPDFVESFDQLSPALQSYFIFTFLKRAPIPVLQTINNIIAPALRRDFLTDLPPELGVQILGYLDAQTLCRASVVCKSWRRLVDGEWRVWKDRLVKDGFWIGDGSEETEVKEIVGGVKENLFLKRWRAGVWDTNAPRGGWTGKEEDDGMHVDGLCGSVRRPSARSIKLASPSSSREASPLWSDLHYTHPFKTLYRRRFTVRRNWAEREPRRVTFACHANNVVTCLQFDKDKIVSASDDHSINVFDTRTGATKAILNGHEGGVWALQYIGNILVSGSTDRTVRVWDLEKAECTHVFVGHTSTVRCLQIVEPQNINPDPNGEPIWEPPYPVIVTGSRDWSLRVWKLPSPGRDNEYHPTVPMSPTEDNTDPDENPFHLRHLAGHRHAVRALAAHGRTLVSGSYDTTVRVWDILTGECKFKLQGHTQKVYSVVYDAKRQQCASGSMDGTVRLWSTETGELRAVLEGHSSLVGLLGLSFRHLVSAAADSTLRIWDPTTGEWRHSLAAHSGAITCFQHDEYKVISGSDGTLKMWDVRDGTFTRDLLTGLTGVWQVSFDQRFCVAAVQRNGQSEFEILDFGSVDGEIEEDPEDLIKIEDEEEEAELQAKLDALNPPSNPSTPSAGPPPRSRNPPPPFLRPSEYPRSSPTNSATGSANGSARGGPVASGSAAPRVVRRSASSRNLQASTLADASSSTGPSPSRPRRPFMTLASLAAGGTSGEDSPWEQEDDDEAGGNSPGMDVEFDDVDVEEDMAEQGEDEESDTKPRPAALQW